MAFYVEPWNTDLEPSDGNVRTWLDNLYSKFQPIEQARWNQSHIDTLFYAGEQKFVNNFFGFANYFQQYQNFNFNICAQPINMVTGYQRQHRKSIIYTATEGGDSKTTDQYTRLIMHANNESGILDTYSKSCELAAIAGMNLMQPYLDYTEDAVNGKLKLKVWEYNSFLVDPYFREPDMSDANFIWCQQYVSKQEAIAMFPNKQVNQIKPMAGTPQRYGRFYFLPENYNMARNDLLVLSYVWYKWKRKRKKLYNKVTQEIFDYTGDQNELQQMMSHLGDLEEIEMEVPTWKLAVVLNEQLMYQGFNPLGFDECPMVCNYWNYDPHLAYYDLRNRSLIRPMRAAQYLFTHRMLTNLDISESTINSGYKRKEDAVANPENLRYAGQGKDIIIKQGYEMTDVEKIVASGTPQSDLELANQLTELMYRVSGVTPSNLGLSEESNVSTLTEMLRQGAGLITLQKFFDQWDTALKLLGNLELKIVQHNWSYHKVARILGEEPTPFFFSKIFAKYHVLCEEGLNTSTQKQYEFAQTMELNQALGGIIPPQWLASKATIQGKTELMELLAQQQQQQAAMAEHTQMLEQAKLDAQLKELYSKAASNIAMAKERYGRFESNVGLLEERMSEVSKNRSLSTKAKMEALEKMIDVIGKYGEIETMLKLNNIESYDYKQREQEDTDKIQAYQEANANEFASKLMQGMSDQSGQQGAQQFAS